MHPYKIRLKASSGTLTFKCGPQERKPLTEKPKRDFSRRQWSAVSNAAERSSEIRMEKSTWNGATERPLVSDSWNKRTVATT